jgi:C1A family cysteine protease
MPTHQFTKWYGWRPDFPDHRDLTFSPPAPPEVLPAKVDLREKCPKIYDQGALGSCTANAIAAAIEFDQIKQGLPEFTPSRLFIYYNERVIEGTVRTDSGAMIRDGIKSINTLGAPPETDWPYKIGKFAARPPKRAFTDGKLHPAVSYARVGGVQRTEEDLMKTLASGFPFVFGFSVFKSFESQDVANSGLVHLPGPDEELVGGHAVLGIGYDRAARLFQVRNSWAANWGDKGHFWMPFEYLTNNNLSDDFWVVTSVK